MCPQTALTKSFGKLDMGIGSETLNGEENVSHKQPLRVLASFANIQE